MEMLAEVLKLGSNLIVPHFIILFNQIGLPLNIKLLNQTTEFDIPKHLKVGLTLNVLIVPHPAKELIRSVLDLNECPRPILVELNTIHASHNLVPGTLNLAYMHLIEGVVTDEGCCVSVGSPILVSCTVVSEEGLTDMLLS